MIKPSFDVCKRLLLCHFMLIGTSVVSKVQLIDSLQKAIARSKPDTHQVTLFHDLAYAYWLEGNDSLAEVHAARSVSLARKTHFEAGEAKARLFLARIEVDRLTYDQQGLAQVDTALSIATKIKDAGLQAQAYVRKAQLLETHIERQKEMPALFDKALAIFRELGDKTWQGIVYNERAQMMMRAGDAAQGIKLFLEARRLQEETRNYKALRSTLPNLGVAFASLGMYRQALDAFDEAEKLPNTKNDNILRGFLLRQRGEVLEKQGEFRRALAALKKAVKVHQALGSSYWLAKTYARMARIYFSSGDLPNALSYNQQADRLGREVASSEDFLDHIVQVNYGKIYLKKRDYNKVIAYATEGLETAMEEEPVLLNEVADYNDQLAQAYSARGDYRRALQHYHAYKAASDSLLNNQAVQKATAASLQFDFDKKEERNKLNIERLENEKLTQARNALIGLSALTLIVLGLVFWSNRKLKDKNAQLEAKNHEITLALQKGKHMERKRVASELHDNLATKLAALRWRMEALDTSALTTRDHEIHAGSLQMLEDIYADVRLISHDMMAVELRNHGLKAALQKLITQLGSSPDITFDLHIITKTRLDEAGELEIYQIVSELLSNAIKHSGADKVEVLLEEEQGHLRVEVRDNGLGFDPGTIQNGVGLKSIAARMEALRGTYHIDTVTQQGTLFKAEIPLNLLKSAGAASHT